MIKIRDGQAVRNFACYLAIGVNLEGERDALGIWFQRTEGAKFWLQVLTELKTRGVQDLLVCCVDGLTGFPEAIEAVYPKAWVQTCIVHAIRSALRFVPYKDKQKVAADLRKIYTAADRDHAEQELERFADSWDPKYPMISASSIENWERIVPFLAFPPDVRRAVYTTDENVKGPLRDSCCFRLMDRSRGGVRGPAERLLWRRFSVFPRSKARFGRVGASSRRDVVRGRGVGRRYAFAWVWSTPERSAGSGTEACRAACPFEGLCSRVRLAAATPGLAFDGALACQSATCWRYQRSACSASSPLALAGCLEVVRGGGAFASALGGLPGAELELAELLLGQRRTRERVVLALRDGYARRHLVAPVELAL